MYVCMYVCMYVLYHVLIVVVFHLYRNNVNNEDMIQLNHHHENVMFHGDLIRYE